MKEKIIKLSHLLDYFEGGRVKMALIKGKIHRETKKTISTSSIENLETVFLRKMLETIAHIG